MNLEFTSRSEEDTEAAAREIARELPRNGIVQLIGDLGAGKTFLARAIVTELGASAEEVTSPSFAIIHEYPLTSGPAILHIDGYRLSDDLREWEQIGIPDMLSSPGLKFIEWPKELFNRFGDSAGKIEILVGEDGTRTILFERMDG